MTDIVETFIKNLPEIIKFHHSNVTNNKQFDLSELYLSEFNNMPYDIQSIILKYSNTTGATLSHDYLNKSKSIVYNNCMNNPISIKEFINFIKTIPDGEKYYFSIIALFYEPNDVNISINNYQCGIISYNNIYHYHISNVAHSKKNREGILLNIESFVDVMFTTDNAYNYNELISLIFDINIMDSVFKMRLNCFNYNKSYNKTLIMKTYNELSAYFESHPKLYYHWLKLLDYSLDLGIDFPYDYYFISINDVFSNDNPNSNSITRLNDIKTLIDEQMMDLEFFDENN